MIARYSSAVTGITLSRGRRTKAKLAKFLVGLDFLERNSTAERPQRLQLDGDPISFRRRGIAECLAKHFCFTDNRLIRDAMIKEHPVPCFHRSQVVAGLKISHARPGGLSILDEVVPGISRRLLLYEPVVHAQAWPTVRPLR